MNSLKNLLFAGVIIGLIAYNFGIPLTWYLFGTITLWVMFEAEV